MTKSETRPFEYQLFHGRLSVVATLSWSREIWFTQEKKGNCPWPYEEMRSHLKYHCWNTEPNLPFLYSSAQCFSRKKQKLRWWDTICHGEVFRNRKLQDLKRQLQNRTAAKLIEKNSSVNTTIWKLQIAFFSSKKVKKRCMGVWDISVALWKKSIEQGGWTLMFCDGIRPKKDRTK